MRLNRLLVKKSINDEIIRDIKFNSEGISLIVDETDNETSGSNIGKTTAVKIIDLCLGAKFVSSIYKEKDTGENHIVREFLENNKVIAELTATIDKKEHKFKRSLYKNGKNEINNEVVKNITEYTKKLNEIIFNNQNNKPTFRQLISKFIRLESSNEDSLLRYLGSFCKNYEYQAIYSYLYGIDSSKSENVDIISLNKSIDKDIDAIFRKNGVSSLSEFEAKIDLMSEVVKKLKDDCPKTSIIDDYEEQSSKMEKLKLNMNKLEGIVAKYKLKIDLIEEKIKKEEKKIFSVDHKLLKDLYDETKLNVSDKLVDFEELEKFHNGMVNKRIEMLRESFIEIKNNLMQIEPKLANLRKEYEDNYITFDSQLKDKLEEKFEEYSVNKEKLQSYNNDYEYIIEKQKEKEQNLEKKVNEDRDIKKVNSISDTLNKYFKYYTEEIIGEPFAIVFNLDENKFPIEIVGMDGKLGTGIKKAMITCFDLAHISLIMEKKYHMPVFEIHDKLENIDLNELNKIINIAKNFKGQYIFPILNDRIDKLNISEEDVVLRLSADNKFFNIK